MNSRKNATAYSCFILGLVFGLLQLSAASRQSDVESNTQENHPQERPHKDKYVSNTGVDILEQHNSRDSIHLEHAASSATNTVTSQNLFISETIKPTRKPIKRLSKDIFKIANAKLPKLKAASWQDCSRTRYFNTKQCGYEAGKFKPFRWVSSHTQCVYNWNDKVEWQTARTRCQDQSEDNDDNVALASPYSVHEIKEIMGAQVISKVWLGWDDLSHEGCFTSVSASSRTSNCRPNDPKVWPLWRSRPNNDDDQDCMSSSKDDGYRTDDNCCDEKFEFMCREHYQDLKTTNLVWVSYDSQVILGDMMHLTVRYSTQLADRLRLRLFDHHDKTIIDFYTAIGDDSSIAKPSNFLPRERIDADRWQFYHNYTRRRCVAARQYRFSLMARRSYMWLHVDIFVNKDFSSRIDRKSGYVSINAGHYFATLIKPQDKRLTLGSTHIFKCLARLGNDKDADVILAIKDIKQSINLEYREDGAQSWSAIFKWDTCQTTAPLPNWFEIDETKCADEPEMGGYHINVTIKIHGEIGVLHLRQLMCKGDTNQNKQTGSIGWEQNTVLYDFNIRFHPQTPDLKIMSDYPDNGIVPGGEVRAECYAYIGTVSYPQAITWLLYSAGATAPTHTWRVEYPYGNTSQVPGVKFSGRPGTYKCHNGDIIYWRTNKCVRFVDNTALSWEDAQQYCNTYFHYNLLVIEDGIEFDDMIEEFKKVGSDAYWIGLNKQNSEGEYRLWDGSRGDPGKWGYWYNPGYELPPSPSAEDCIIMHTGGMEKFVCSQRMRFVCQSHTNRVVSYRNFDPHLGPNWTAIATIDTNQYDLLNGSRLQCKTDRDSTVDAAMSRKGISEFSIKSRPFHYVYVPSKPTVTAVEVKGASDFFINLTCSSNVALHDGSLTWVWKYPDKSLTHKWRVDTGADVVVINGRSNVDVYKTVDEINKRLGRFMESRMEIKIDASFTDVVIVCYSYDLEKPTNWTVNVTLDNLNDAHFIDLRHLKDIAAWEIEDIIEKKEEVETSKEAFSKPKGRYMLYGLLALLATGLAAVLFMTKDSIITRKKVVQEEGNQKSQVNVAQVNVSVPAQE